MMLPNGTVLDGEILGWKEANVRPSLNWGSCELGEKLLEPRNCWRTFPVILMAYDLLEFDAQDCRQKPLSERRSLLTRLLMGFQPGTAGALAPSCQRLSSAFADITGGAKSGRLAGVVETTRIGAYSQCGRRKTALSRLASPYRVGRQRGDWWKWKVNPYTMDAVLIYAQRGSGKRASLYTDYTFGIWDNGTLVPYRRKRIHWFDRRRDSSGRSLRAPKHNR